ncbi:hypothetical protein PQR68_37400, partial [Paraburkholderia agricolaris]|uniref:hypothetical protein n=1 Tax=Paraburkholderia agricolaris TaxID=2152888 RepID=UPI0038BA195A
QRPDTNPSLYRPLSLIRQGFPACRLRRSENFFQTRFSIDSHLETSVISTITLFHIQPAGFDGARSATANPAEQGRRVPLLQNRAGLREPP